MAHHPNQDNRSVALTFWPSWNIFIGLPPPSPPFLFHPECVEIFHLMEDFFPPMVAVHPLSADLGTSCIARATESSCRCFLSCCFLRWFFLFSFLRDALRGVLFSFGIAVISDLKSRKITPGDSYDEKNTPSPHGRSLCLELFSRSS